ncbi:hypothetical protein [Aureibacillus halotolerans]|uniref:Uncharacterized protein n=1 Tax=Aureibacillus halotolerans TaxID=1508390 RepID=A0A4R6TPA0_9BACI|nr:hypothetical protein [Aureibacillus halotolerans]TDQ33432.1 hypothetical protein EV213_1315 [Aureibacillus halotolerans]
MRNVLVKLFKICLVLFLAGGTCLVIGQLAGVIFQSGYLIEQSWDLFANPTFIISAVAGIIGFIIGYFPAEKTEDEEENASGELKT